MGQRKDLTRKVLEELKSKCRTYIPKIPEETEVLRKETYDGIVRDVSKDENEVRVDIFDDDGRRLNDVFPISLFRGKKPEVDDDVKYHTWQLKSGQYDGYFEVIGYVPVEMLEEDRKEIDRIFKEWEKELVLF